jgi:trk system potassium uptake protein TrkH
LIELIATIFLSFDWVPKLGFWKGIYYSVFHSVSAFNNAGFSLWHDSLARFSGDPVVNLVIAMLIITGGLGFTVIADIWYSKEFHQLTLHSKLMIYGTVFINIAAILLFFMLEYNNPGTIGKMPLFDKMLTSFFQGITPRTAGFQTVDMTDLRPGTAIIMIMLMFIGAGSGSTGSGIKVTTFLVLLLSVIAFIRGKEETVAFSRSIKLATLYRSMAVVVVSLTALFIAVLLLTITEPHVEFLRLLF